MGAIVNVSAVTNDCCLLLLQSLPSCFPSLSKSNPMWARYMHHASQEVEGGVAAIAATLLKHVLEPLKGELDISSLETSAATAARK